MKESDTYMEILEEGATAALHRLLLRQGEKRFGPADAATKAAIEGITDLPRLESLSERILDVSSWQELLGRPTAKRRNGRKRKS